MTRNHIPPRKGAPRRRIPSHPLRRRVRGELQQEVIEEAIGSFQLPPSHEGEPPIVVSSNAKALFQLPPSHEGEPTSAVESAPLLPFQLPPSHEGERS